jgi:hypothetical protein
MGTIIQGQQKRNDELDDMIRMMMTVTNPHHDNDHHTNRHSHHRGTTTDIVKEIKNHKRQANALEQ